MISQIFIKIPNIQLLFDLLEKITNYNKNFFFVNKAAFKLMINKNIFDEFIDKIKEFYRPNKKFYVERKIDYKKFITIIRQICNINNVGFSYYFEYNKSTYEIVYKISKNITTF